LQVKVHGFRIELGEIEAVLRRHPAVRDALVLAVPASTIQVEGRLSTNSDKRLVAYLVLNQTESEQPITLNHEQKNNPSTITQAAAIANAKVETATTSTTASELRSYLREKLPEYMAPALFVFLPAFPLTSNGKIDRKALPFPEWLDTTNSTPIIDTDNDDNTPGSRTRRQTQYTAPRTAVEEELVWIWAEVLGLEARQVGAHDDFFASGGHSLLAVRLTSRVRDVFSVEVPLSYLFQYSTVADLSMFVRNSLLGQLSKPLPRKSRMPRNDDVALPASYAQQRLWFIEQLLDTQGAYNMPTALRLSGSLDVAALEQSLSAIIARHEALRTIFPTQPATSSIDARGTDTAEGDGLPRQVILPPWPVKLALLDLSHEQLEHTAGSDRAPEPEAQAVEVINAEAYQRFDLVRGPLVRFTLLKLAPADFIFMVNMHHIVSDGWSQAIFFDELATFYAFFTSSAGTTAPAGASSKPAALWQHAGLGELAFQYADYAQWQREWLSSPLLQSHLDYWQKQLAGKLPALQIPTDFPRPARVEYLGASRSLALSKALTTALKLLSMREKVTLFMTLLAAFKTVLHRHTGQEDIIVGTPIAARQSSETEQLIGLFVNMLPLRTNLSGDPTFAELLARVREVLLGAYAHQDIPFEKLVEELRPDRTLFQNPFFDVVINFGGSSTQHRGLPGITQARLTLSEVRAKYPITLFVREHAGSLQLQIAYPQALFSPERIECLLTQLSFLLTQVAHNPKIHIGSYSLVTPEAKALLPDPTIAQRESYYPAVTVSFEEWVRRSPQQHAVIQGKNSWSYHELSKRARSIAQLLLANGLSRGEVVAISGQSSFGFVASLIGTLMSGGVLLTLDPNLPDQRRKLMLHEAGARYVLAQRDAPLGADIVPPRAASFSFDKDTGQVGELEGELRKESALPHIQPADSAYIFFTSGSTGMPNAVLGTHKGISHFLNWQRQTFDIGLTDRVSQLIGLSFDAILRDILLPLTSGATLCLPDVGTDNRGEHTLLWLERMGVTVCHAVPSLAQTWLSTTPMGANLSKLRWFFLSGEPLLDTFVHNWRSAFPHSGQIVNFYGPTETTMIKCYYILPEEVPPGIQPAGRPLPETQALVLRRDKELCGLCEVGEIVIRTPFRTSGYIHPRAATEQRFASNPFRSDLDDIVYYTGDLGRFDPRGNLEVLGRLDNQVKLWGVRIEPEEIEGQLAQHPDIRQVAVIVQTSDPLNRYLAAFVVIDRASTTTANELQRFLRQRLPEYMVPKNITLMRDLPLTASGKTDRLALAALAPVDSAASSGKREYIAPSTATQSALARMWEDGLGVRVSVSDSFLDLGGHSLLAAQITARARQVFHTELPLRLLFEEHTLGDIADYIDAAVASQPRHQGGASVDSHNEDEREEGEL